MRSWKSLSGEMHPAIAVTGLTRRWGAVKAIDAITLQVQQGEVFGLLGPNGAGKTTTLECILGLVRPDEGQILVLGQDAGLCPRAVKAKMGAVLQSTGLQDKITPREALDLFRRFYSNALQTDDLITRFGLGQKQHAHFETLSGGQKQRLALALALVGNPKVLVLDEPSQGLDPVMRRQIQDHILALKHDGCSILLATHDMQEAERLCDRVAIIAQGRIVACAAPSALIHAVPGASLEDVILHHTDRSCAR